MRLIIEIAGRFRSQACAMMHAVDDAYYPLRYIRLGSIYHNGTTIGD